MYARAHDRRRLTLAEYAVLPEEDGYRAELSRGLLVREPLPGLLHSDVQGNAFALLRAQQAGGRGRAVIGAGFLLSVDPPTVRGPDVAFIAAGHLPARLPEGWFEGAPDLVVEVLSPTNRRGEMRAKVRDYLAAGTRLVWLVDPRTRSVTVHAAESAARRLGAADDLDGGEVLPELRVAAISLFTAP